MGRDTKPKGQGQKTSRMNAFAWLGPGPNLAFRLPLDPLSGSRALLARIENWNQRYSAEPDLLMVPLDHDRSRLELVRIERASGYAFDHGVIVHLRVVQENRHAVPHDRS